MDGGGERRTGEDRGAADSRGWRRRRRRRFYFGSEETRKRNKGETHSSEEEEREKRRRKKRYIERKMETRGRRESYILEIIIPWAIDARFFIFQLVVTLPTFSFDRWFARRSDPRKPDLAICPRQILFPIRECGEDRARKHGDAFRFISQEFSPRIFPFYSTTRLLYNHRRRWLRI